MGDFLQLEYTLSDPVASSSPLIFDSIKAQNNIVYDDASGQILFNEPGTYQVNWWVATQSSGSPSVNFVLEHNDNSQAWIDNSCSSAKTGQTSGTAVFQINEVPHAAYLINDSGQPFYYPPNVPVKAMLTIVKTSPEGIALVPFGSIYVDSSVDAEEASFYLGNPVFGGQTYSYYSETFPLTIDMEDFTEIQSFSVPRDGVITGISGVSWIFSGEMGYDTYFLHAALYESPPGSSEFNYIAESDVTLTPGFNRDTPKPFTVSGTKSFIYPVTAGTRLAMFVYVRSDTLNLEPAETTGNFSGRATIMFD